MKSSGSSIGLVGALGLLFVGLKLGGAIDWSWWYVTLPFWGGAALAVLIVVVAALLMFAAAVFGRD